jgi:quercetin dioxygenase-like cupin family protein
MPPGDHSPSDDPSPSSDDAEAEDALDGDQPGDVLMVEHLLAPGGLIPAARSSDHDRYAFVLQGQMTARVGRETVFAGPGSIVSIPRGFRHAMWNTDGVLVRVLVLHVFGPGPAPAGKAA